MTKEQKISIFKEVLEKFETEEIRLYCEDMIGLIPDDSLVLPSSTSLKYHSPKQCEIWGNAYHLVMVGEVCNYLLGLEHNINKFPRPKQRDCIRTASILHDAVKLGWNGSQYSLFNHPILAADWIKETVVEHDIKQALKDYIAGCVASHSGQWNTSNRSKEILPKPETEEQMLIHTADYLSSRANIDMTYSEEFENTIKELTEDLVSTYKFSFGKHKGETVKYVYDNHIDYLRWMHENNKITEPIKTIVENLSMF